MAGEISYNATSTAFSAMSTISPSTWGPAFAAILTIATLFALFMLVTNFRRLIYGLCVAAPIALVGWFSWSVTKPAMSGDWKPFAITVSSIAGVFILIVVGKFMEGLKWVKDFEKKNLR